MFRFTKLSNLSLQQNGPHQFAVRHSMSIYRNDAIYTLIPKNGCSTMRLSIAIENGCIDDIDQGHWIHKNNQSFMPNHQNLVKAKYKFVVLRCPFRRLASVFLDKFVSKEIQAWHYRDTMKRKVNLDDLTFESFVKSLRSQPVLVSDIHWRPQIHFLAYEHYDDYFSLEDFHDAKLALEKKIGLKMVDARPLTEHGVGRYDIEYEGYFGSTYAFDIAKMKREGKCPDHRAMYNAELIDLVKSLYEKDLALYRKHCNDENILFR